MSKNSLALAWFSMSLTFLRVNLPLLTYIPEPFVALLLVTLQLFRVVSLVMYNAPPFSAVLLVKLLSLMVTAVFT
jgi:hypothetical protein